MKIEINEINDSIKDYLLKTNWHLIECQDSGLFFYAKKRDGEELPKISGHSKSKNPREPFIYDSVNEKFLSLEKVIAKAKNIFEKNYKGIDPVNVINKNGDTNFIGAPIQALDNIIVGNDSFADNPYFIIQPTIRENAINKVGNKVGVSSSFITLSSQRINSNLQGYITDIDNWLSFLSKIGLNLFEVFLYPNSLWDAGEKMKGVALTAYSGRLQLGDFVFVNEIQNKSNLFIHDVNFGLERILWCINKRENYFDSFNPISYSKEFTNKQLDLIRTASLIFFSGGKGGSKNNEQNSRDKKYDGIPRITREIISTFVAETKTVEVIHLLEYYFSFWSNFYSSNLSLENFKSEILREMYFAYNKMLCDSLGVKVNPNDKFIFENPNAFINNCLADTNRKIPYGKIKSILSKP